MNSVPGLMSVIRAGTTTRPRRDVTCAMSPSAMPSRSASAADISTNGSGAASFNALLRPVFVRVWKWYTMRPVVSQNG
jgi:hypothetical protein